MRRREFIAGLGSAAAWPLLAVQAQQRAVTTIGVLGAASAQGYADQLAALRKGLREAGFFEGQNLAIEYRWAEEHFDRLPALANALVNQRPSVIVTEGGTATALAAKAATTIIPIVFAVGGDPVESGLVASLNRPGGNITGIASFSEILNPKRLALAAELAPKGAVVAFLHNTHNPNLSSETKKVEEAAHAIERQVLFLDASDAQQFDQVFARLVEARISMLIVADDTLFVGNQQRLVSLAARHRVSAIYPFRDFVLAGGLISYGDDIVAKHRQVGLYVGRILRGEKPANLPVMLPTKLQLVINLKTAKALGLTIPETLLATADEVIQ
jgi:putative tryptophan/tyrosine transport system substrate-binding protein